MSKDNTAKSTERKSSAPSEALVLSADDMNNPLIKKYLKLKQEKAAADARKKHIPEILKKAGELTGQEFKTLAALVSYFEPKPRAKALEESDKKKIDDLHAAGNSIPQIAEKLKKKYAQVNRYIASKKK